MPGKHASSTRLARQALETAIAAPQVIALRTARMALAGANPSARDRLEFQRMHAEKHDAFQESWLAMWTESLRIQQKAALTMMGAWWLPKSAVQKLVSPAALSRDALAILGKGVAPVRRKAVANARRLAKDRRS